MNRIMYFRPNVNFKLMGFDKLFIENDSIPVECIFISFSYNCFDSQFVLEGSYLVNKPIYANYPIID